MSEEIKKEKVSLRDYKKCTGRSADSGNDGLTWFELTLLPDIEGAQIDD